MQTADSWLGSRAPALLFVALGWGGSIDDSQCGPAAALRALRSEPAAGPALVERLVAPGADAIARLLDILVEERIPLAQAQDAPQLLSAPQRELLLAALARLPADRVRAELLQRLEPSAGPADPPLRIAALRVFSVIGTGADLARLPALAPRAAGELTPAAGEALRAAYAAILRRAPELLDRRTALLRGLDETAARQLLFALGDLRDRRALRLLDECVRTLPEHAQQAVALVARIGASGDADLDQPLSDWLVERLDAERIEWTRASLRAIGVLDDGRAVPALIGELEGAHPGLREAALGALRQISGLKLGGSAEAWREWHARELAWLESERPAAQAALASGNEALAARALRDYAEHRLFRGQLAEDVLPLLEDGAPALRALASETLARLRQAQVLR